MTSRSSDPINWYDMAEIPYRASRLLKALGNPKTFALVKILLREKVLAVDEMIRRLDRSQPAISKILRPLRDLDVVRYQRRGKEVVYTLKDPAAIERILDGAEKYAKRAAAKTRDKAAV